MIDENKPWPTRSPMEILESHVNEISSIHGILRNIERERIKARKELNLPEDTTEDVLWVEAFSIITDKTKTDQEKSKELKSRFIILENRNYHP